MKIFKVMQTAFENYDKSVRNYLSKTFASLGLEYTPNQIFGVIYDGVKGVMQNIMFYIEDALTEQNISTAIRKKSIYSLARQSGYEAFYGSAANGVIDASISLTSSKPSGTSSKIYIKDGSSLVNDSNGLQYTIMLPTDEYVIDISKPLRTHRFKLVQGSKNEAYFVAKGEPFETFEVDLSGMFDREYVEVYVNGEKWKNAASLYDMNEDDKMHTVHVGFENTFEVTFGNGVHGRVLREGDNVIIKYFQHNGELGNVTKYENSSFSFVTPCYNAYGNTINGNEYIRISMPSPISGGTNPDSIKMVRKMVGYNSRSFVLASEENYKLFLRRFSFVGQSTVYCNAGSLSVVASCLTSKKDQLNSPSEYLELDEKDMLLSDVQKEIVLSSLERSNKTFLGATFAFEDPIIRKYAMVCYVKCDSVFNRDTVKESIRNTVASYFMDLPENTSFIAKSDIIKAVIDANDDIVSFDFDFISDKNEKAYKDGFYDDYEHKVVNGMLKLIPVRKVYDPYASTGLDAYGNISLQSNIEIPLLHGNFRYYPNKKDNDKSTSIMVPSIDVMFH